jgi:hypothetical protein
MHPQNAHTVASSVLIDFSGMYMSNILLSKFAKLAELKTGHSLVEYFVLAFHCDSDEIYTNSQESAPRYSN